MGNHLWRYLLEPASLKQAGGPLSWTLTRRIMQDKGVTELGCAEEPEAIEAEADTQGSSNPQGPEDDESKQDEAT